MARRRKNKQCKSCRKWFTANRIGKHAQQCANWARSPSPESDEDTPRLQRGLDVRSSDISSDNISISTSSEPEEGEPIAGEGPVYSPPPFFNLPEADVAMDWVEDLPQDFPNPEERVYDDSNDEDWWNEYVVPEPEQDLMVDDSELEEFDELLNWIDADFDLEVAQNCE